MADRDPAVDRAIEDALDALYRMEQLLMKVDRNKIIAAIDALKKALELEGLREALEVIPHTELDMRMARLRIQALTGLQPPAMVHAADATPVEPMKVREALRGETKPGLGSISSSNIPKPKRPPR